MRRHVAFVLTAILPALHMSSACSGGRRISVGAVESAYEEVRTLKDQIDVTRARGAPSTPAGTSLSDLLARYRPARERLQAALGSASTAKWSGDDRKALEVMQRTFERDLVKEEVTSAAGEEKKDVDCAYDAAQLAQGPDGLKTLSERMYACFGLAAHALPFEGQTLDRLTIFSLLPVTADPDRRRRLFLAFGPVWKSINGDDGPTSPYRQMVRLSSAKMAAEKTSVEAGAASLGIEPHHVEEWLVAVLEAWRRTSPDREVEPWDFSYEAGKASRELKGAIPVGALRPTNDRFYHDLGADPQTLNIAYDLAPRDGKTPVAFTTFGARPRRTEDGWSTGEPWVFASYAVGSVDNMNELLHETGHAIHIAAIRTRPAYMDWPDSDLFTEAIADIVSLDMFEPAWQKKYLGVSVPLADSLRAKYAGIVMDIAWALFEIRMHRAPESDPNEVWTEITQRYFRIKPHPELSWWALRGQLVDLPGYMLNYAVGAILIADLRQRARELRGATTEGDPGWYPWISERLYRYGLERPSRQVIEDFLGRPISERALLGDLARATPTS